MSRKANARSKALRRAYERAEHDAELRTAIADGIVRRITQDGLVRARTGNVQLLLAQVREADIARVMAAIVKRRETLAAKRAERDHRAEIAERMRRENAQRQSAIRHIDDHKRATRSKGVTSTFVGYVTPRDGDARTRMWTAVTPRLASQQEVSSLLYADRAFRAVFQDMTIVRYTASDDGVEPTFPTISGSRMRRRHRAMSMLTARQQHDEYLASRLHEHRKDAGIHMTATQVY